MASAIFVLAAALLVAAAILAALWLRCFPKRLRRLPPGPKGWPVIGNALQLSGSPLWVKAREWAETYGDVVYVENYGSPMLLINSYEAAVELLTVRSAKYSSRPPLVMAKLEGWGWLTSFLPYGEAHRKQRAFQHRFLNSTDVVNYVEIQQQEALVMLKGILESPSEYGKHLRRLPGAVVMKNFYGYQVRDEDDPYVELGEAAVKLTGESEHYFYLDHLPWLRYLPDWFPWIEFPRVAKEARKVSHAVLHGAHDMVKQKLMGGTATPSATSILIHDNARPDGTIEDEDEIAASMATLFIGGVDTSVTALMTFVLAMLKYPEVQERAILEVKDVVGEHRLPVIEDRHSMPFVRSICTEVLRWQSILPLLVAHQTTEDDEHQGYFIPAGTTVLANVWAMSHDPRHFFDSTEFCPERWLMDKEKGDSSNPRAEDFIFGFGRRACPGQKWAEDLLFIAISSLIAAFKFESATRNGMIVPPNDSYVEGFVWHLGPSECMITPRSETMANLIRQAELV